MKRMQRAVLLAELTDRLRSKGSWSGETHIQKSTYLLQELLLVPTGFEFVLYKFGPYSFDLSDELTALRADELLELRVRHPSYGPTFRTTDSSVELRKRYPVTLATYSDKLEFVASKVGDQGVTDLERLATALYVTRKSAVPTSVKSRARRLTELKPHVPVELAIAAVEEFDKISQDAKSKFPELAT